MPLAAELELPSFDHTDVSLRGAHYRQAMADLRGHDGWLAASPFARSSGRWPSPTSTRLPLRLDLEREE